MGASRIGRLEAAGPGLGTVGRVSSNDIVMTDRARRGRSWQLWLPAALCLLVVGIEQFRVLAVRAPMLRAIIETEISLCMLAAAALFALSFSHRRRLRDLLLAGALLEVALIDFVSYVVPAAIDVNSAGFLTAANLFGKLFMSGAILASTLLARDRQVGRGGKPLLMMLGASLLAAGLAELGGLALRPLLLNGGGVTRQGIGAALAHPLGLALAATASTGLLLGAVRTARIGRTSPDGATLLLAAAIMAIGGAGLNFLVLPTSGAGFVTPREGLRVIAYGLILAAALRQEAMIRREIAAGAAAAERRRIARDLHDGLAQDLAFIAAHGDRLGRDLGEEHPVAVAAKRALAVSRGAIVDLSATGAPTTKAALRQVADELEVRFGVRVSLEADDAGLAAEARDDVVRIVREGIVNAAKGGARNLVVSLERRTGHSVLRILDDGVGIRVDSMKSRAGFGLRSMRERAEALGGGLTARRRRSGGTELEIIFR